MNADSTVTGEGGTNMNNMTARQLKTARNLFVTLEIVFGFMVWLAMPGQIRNSRLIHVGSSEYGGKWGFLPVILFPLFALIPQKNKEEIHTEDPEERKKTGEEREKQGIRMQILYALMEGLVALFVLGLGFMA